MKMLERIVEFTPAFDKRDPDPQKNFGIGGVDLRMVLKGPEGAVQFLLLTQWMLPNVQAELDARATPRSLSRPIAADLGYHSRTPRYDGQKPMGSEKYDLKALSRNLRAMANGGGEPEVVSHPTGTFTPCEYLDGEPCYYDGSGLNADRIWLVLLHEGSEGVWRELEQYYADVFHAEAVES